MQYLAGGMRLQVFLHPNYIGRTQKISDRQNSETFTGI